MMQRAILIVSLLIAASMSLGAAAAQELVDPLTGHAQEKLDAAQEDPSGFALEHASEEGIDAESRWVVGYTCFAAREAAKEAGPPPPELGVCPRFEDVDEADDEDLADAEELNEVVAEANALKDDAIGTAERIVDDPEGAVDETVGLLERTRRAIERLIDDVLSGLATASAAVAGFAGPVAMGLWESFIATALLPAAATRLAGSALVAVASAAWDGLGFAARAVAATVGSAAEAVSATARALGDAAANAASAVRDAVSSLLGESVERADAPARTVEDAREPVDDLTRGLDLPLELP